MHNAPLFFLHLPRTGGTTVDDIFFNNIPPDRVIRIYRRDEFEKYKYIEEGELENIDYITGHILLSGLNPPQFYGRNVRAFTFLRDPVKRLFSEYIFLKTWKNQHLYEYLNSRNISFGEYVTSHDKALKYRGKNFMTRCLSGDSLEETDLAQSLEKAKFNLERNLIFFGLQERFMESMLLLARKAGLKNALHQRRNSLNYGAGQKMSDEERELAIEYNGADIELYRFAADLFEKRIQAEGEEFQKSLANFKFLNSKYQKLSSLLHSGAGEDGAQGGAIELSKDVKW